MRYIFGFFGTTLLTFSIIASASPVASQEADPSIWNSIEIADNGAVTNEEAQQDPLCFSGEVRYRKAAGPLLDLDFGFFSHDTELETKSDPIASSCITVNGKGLFAGRYFSPSGDTNRAMRLNGSRFGTSYAPAPAGGHVIEQSFVSTRAAYTYAINQDITDGELDYYPTGFLTYDIDWEPTSFTETIRYESGEAVLFSGHRFSQNGKYFVAQIDGNTFARVDMATQEMTPFYRTLSTTTRKAYAISGDGRYAFTDVDNKILIHDLAGCEETYQKGMWQKASTTAVPDGCIQSRNLESQINTATGGFDGGYYSGLVQFPNFSLNGAEIELFAGKNVSDWKKVTLNAADYTPTNEGYLALGDSFSSGEGDLAGGTWYEPGTDEQGNKDTFENRNLCHLSRRSYPYLIAVELGYLSSNTQSPSTDGLFHSVACSGAKIHNIVGDPTVGLQLGLGNEDAFRASDNQYSLNYSGSLGLWQPGRVKQLDQVKKNTLAGLTPFDEYPEAITLGIGGNDADFGEIVNGCVIDLSTCKFAEDGSEDASNLAITIAQLKDRLADTYKQVIAETNGESRLYVHGYPDFVQVGGSCAINVRLDVNELRMVSEGVQYMNAVVEAAAKEAGAFYVNVENILDGSDLCSSAEEKSFNGITAGDDITSTALNILSRGVCFVRAGCIGKESFHPNQNGQELYKEAILQQTNSFQAVASEPTPQPIPTPTDFFGVKAAEYVGQANLSGGVSPYVLQPNFFITLGQTEDLLISHSGFRPGSEVEVVLRSDPVSLGVFTVDETGVLETEITLSDIEGGLHSIHIGGISEYGERVEYFESIVLGYAVNDFDGDGILDGSDNCKIVENSGQDIDKDGIDDVCDAEAVAPPEPPESPNHPACRILDRLSQRLPWRYQWIIRYLQIRFECL